MSSIPSGIGDWFTNNQGNVVVLASQPSYHASVVIWEALTTSPNFPSSYEPSEYTLYISILSATFTQLYILAAFCTREFK